MTDQLPPLTIDSQRIETRLDELASYTDAPPPAVTRVLFTPTELAARDYIRDLFTAADLTLHEDAVGNIFARWAGTQPDLPAVATGSHIDAIPFSGRFDGTVGVIGAIEAVHTLRDAGFTPQRSIEIIMFTAEEPTRFGVGCLGSRALAGILSPADLRALRDTDNTPFDAVRQQAGYTDPLDTVRLPEDAYHAFIELHIEQGTRLEQAGDTIGIVSAIAAPATLRVIIYGNGGHAGTVLMPDRQDALPVAAEIILAVERAAQESISPDAVATVGFCDVHPNAVNSIPARVTLEIDIRDINLESRNRMIEVIQVAISDIFDERGLSITTSIINSDRPAHASDTLVEMLQTIAQQQGYARQTLISRAYHDTLFMADLCPTSMIFVPSQNGYSHRPEEFTATADIVKGVDVLARTLARLSSET